MLKNPGEVGISGCIAINCFSTSRPSSPQFLGTTFELAEEPESQNRSYESFVYIYFLSHRNYFLREEAWLRHSNNSKDYENSERDHIRATESIETPSGEGRGLLLLAKERVCVLHIVFFFFFFGSQSEVSLLLPYNLFASSTNFTFTISYSKLTSA